MATEIQAGHHKASKVSHGEGSRPGSLDRSIHCHSQSQLTERSRLTFSHLRLTFKGLTLPQCETIFATEIQAGHHQASKLSHGEGSRPGSLDRSIDCHSQSQLTEQSCLTFSHLRLTFQGLTLPQCETLVPINSNMAKKGLTLKSSNLKL